MKINPKFQALIPPLSPEEFSQLEANIIADGCRDPLVTWSEGVHGTCKTCGEHFGFVPSDLTHCNKCNHHYSVGLSGGVCGNCHSPISKPCLTEISIDCTLIDGHNRYAICQKHGIEFDTKPMQFEDEDAAMVWIIRNQFGRRNLPPYTRAELALKLEPLLRKQAKENQGTRTDIQQKSAECLKPLDTRKELARVANVSHDTITKVKAINQNGSADDIAALRAGLKSINEVAIKLKKEARAVELGEQRAEVAKAGASIKPSDRWQVQCADMATWTTDKKFDFIITDPPYPKEFLQLYETLAIRSNDWLKDGGMLVAMCGQSYLNQIYEAMSKHLTYYWTACYFLPGQPTPLRQVNVNTTWKPLLIFTKGKYRGKIFGDVFRSDGNDKDHHKWGQSESGMLDIISKLVLPGQSVLDPFCGAGTTGVAALRHGCLFDGIELDKDNANISKKRMNEI